MKEFKIAQFEDDSGDRLTVKSIVKSLKKKYKFNIVLKQYLNAIDLRSALSNDEEYDLLIIDMFDDDTGHQVGEEIIADNDRNNKIPTIIYTQGTVKGNRTNFSSLFEKYNSIIKPSIHKNDGDKLADLIRSIIEEGTVPFELDDKVVEKKIVVYPKIKYAIITALYDDEFEQLARYFDFPKSRQIKTATKIFYRGYFKKDNNIEVVAAIPNATGMVDSSILATQMLEYFRPDYLLMSGVCGGSSELNFGDIVVAKQIYTFQKGKLSDIKRKNESGEMVLIDLFTIDGLKIDPGKLYDNEGHQVVLSVEKFEIEHDSVIELDSLIEDTLKPHINEIKDEINAVIRSEQYIQRDLNIEINLEPIACSTMVINRQGLFEDTIRGVHRKVAAVEMESYGVARSCRFANNGLTKPLIFKSVMDKTTNKADVSQGFNCKKFAAHTSAMFMNSIFERGII